MTRKLKFGLGILALISSGLHAQMAAPPQHRSTTGVRKGQSPRRKAITVAAPQTEITPEEIESEAEVAQAPPPPPPLVPEVALEAYSQGLAASDREDWIQAILYFDKAHKLAPLCPLVLFNLALAESKLPGREVRSLVWFKAYLSTNPPADRATAVQEVIQGLQAHADASENKLVEAGRKLADEFPNDAEKMSAIVEVAKAQAAAGDFAGAKKLAQTLDSSRPSTLLEIAKLQATAGQFAGAKETAESIPEDHLSDRSSAYQSIAIAQAKAGDLEGARATISLATHPGLKYLGLIALARAQYQSGKHTDAFASLVEARDDVTKGSSTDYSYREVAVAQAEVGDVDGARVTQRLIHDDGQRKGIDGPVSAAYLHLAAERLHAGNSEEAVQLASSASPGYDRDRFLDDVGQRAYAEFCKKLESGDWAAAAEFGRRIPYSRYQSLARLDLVRRFLAANDLNSAQVEAGEMPTATLQASAFIFIAEGQRASADEAGATQSLLAAKRALHSVPKPDSNAVVLHTNDDLVGLTKAFLNMDEWEAATDAASLVPDDAFDGFPALEPLVRYLASNNNYGQASAMVNAHAHGKKDSQLYRMLVVELARNGAPDQALSAVSTITDKPDQAVAYSELATSYAQSGKFTEALEWAGKLNVEYAALGSSVYSTIAQKQAQKRDFPEALKSAELISNPDRRDWSFAVIAEAEARSEAGADALQTAARITSSDLRAPAFQRVVEALLQRQDAVRASQALSLMPEGERRDSCYRSMARFYASQARFEDARAAARGATSDAARAASYLEIGDQLLRRLYRDLAAETFDEAMQFALRVADAGVRIELYSQIGEAAYSELPEVGRRAFARALAATAAMEKLEARDSQYRVLAETFRRVGMMEEMEKSFAFAADTEMAMPAGADSKNRGAAALVGSLAESGDLLQAQELAWQITDSGLRDHALARVAAAQAARGDLPSALQAARGLTFAGSRSSFYLAVMGQYTAKGDLTSAAHVATLIEANDEREDAFLELSQAYAKAGDFAQMKQYAARIRNPSKKVRICSAVALSGDYGWVQHTAALIKDRDAADTCLLALEEAPAKKGDWALAESTYTSLPEELKTRALVELCSAGDLEFCRRNAGLLSSSDPSQQARAVAGLAGSDFALMLAHQIQQDPYRARALESIVTSKANADDFGGAASVAAEIMEANFMRSAYQKIAAAQIQKKDLRGARETLHVLHGKLGIGPSGFQSWANYVISTYQPLLVAKQTVVRISDPYWRSRAYSALAGREKNSVVARQLLVLVPEPVIRSQTAYSRVLNEVGAGKLAEAGAHASTIPDTEYKFMAVREVMLDAFAQGKWPLPAMNLRLLPDGADKSLLYLQLSRYQSSKGQDEFALNSLRTAESSLAAMPDDYFKAHTYAEIGKRSLLLKDAVLAEEALHLASVFGRGTRGLGRLQWMRYMDGPAPTPPSHNPDVQLRKNLEAWSRVAEGDFNKPLFTDFRGYLGSISNQAKSSAIFDGMVGAARGLSDALLKIRETEVQLQANQ